MIIKTLQAYLSSRINTFPQNQQTDTSIRPSVKDFAECGFFSHSAIALSSSSSDSDAVACFFW